MKPNDMCYDIILEDLVMMRCNPDKKKYIIICAKFWIFFKKITTNMFPYIVIFQEWGFPLWKKDEIHNMWTWCLTMLGCIYVLEKITNL